MFRKIATFRGDSAFSTWLHRIAVNTVLMHFRKKSLNQVSLEKPYNDSDGANRRREYGAKDNRLVGCVDRVALACAIKELPRGYRTIFLLHEVQGYDHQEIAEMLGCWRQKNSKSQLHKAKLRIRERLARSPKAGFRPFESCITHQPAGPYLRRGGCPSAECRNQPHRDICPQLIPTRWQPGVKTNYQRQVVGSTRLPRMIRATCDENSASAATRSSASFIKGIASGRAGSVEHPGAFGAPKTSKTNFFIHKAVALF